MTYHPVTEQIQRILKDHDVWFETFEHEPVRTSEEAAGVRHGYGLSQGAKALIVRVIPVSGEERRLMLVVPGDKRFSGSKVKKLLDARDVRFASPEEIAEVTGGVQVGGVPPFGNLFGLEVIVDPSLLANEKIIFNAGDRSFSIAMKSEDYKKVVNPRVEEIV